MRRLFSIVPNYTVGEAVADTLIEVAARNAPNTHAAYAVHARRFLEVFGASTPLRNVTEELLRDHQNRRLMAGAARSSVNQERCFISRLFQQAIRRKRVAANAVKGVPILKPNNAREVFVQKDKETLLYEEFRRRWPHEPLNALIARVYVLTGMRRMEFFNLERRHVDFQNAELCIPKAKGGKRRWVVLNIEAMALLTQILEMHDEPHVIPSIFACRSRFILGKVWVTTRYRPAADAVGLNGVRLHDFGRHGFASRLASKGVDIFALQLLLGHADIRDTQRYVHLNKARLREVVALAD